MIQGTRQNKDFNLASSIDAGHGLQEKWYRILVLNCTEREVLQRELKKCLHNRIPWDSGWDGVAL